MPKNEPLNLTKESVDTLVDSFVEVRRDRDIARYLLNKAEGLLQEAQDWLPTEYYDKALDLNNRITDLLHAEDEDVIKKLYSAERAAVKGTADGDNDER